MRISDWSSDVCSSDLSASSAEEVRRTLGYPQSSTSILLRSLASLGYLNYEPLNRTFRPTIRVALLGAWLVEEIDEDRNPTKMMRSLSEATGDMIILGTEHGLEAVYLKVLQATNPVRFHMKQGARWPLCTTPVGQRGRASCREGVGEYV